ncbi:MAG: TAT-variant-translocated molybdopterin oxidoreductase [Acidobacteria bacterium]|nr:TAT-variant-translocated molybdopterin oxidoreductase [Acidobacteriota bacterium]MBW4046338.1 TAT-variant-translocated molybdopterin oxidoreductase [Acidobacteriota bacterium]
MSMLPEKENQNQMSASEPGQRLTLEEVRAKLKGQTGKKYWRSLDELADKPEFGEMLSREFPQQASEWIDPVTRRGFLKLAGASMALAGVVGCTKQPDEPIYPYIKQPEDLVLGRPVYFATAHPFPMGALPLLVKSDAYRPIKLDGNPEHPMAHGSSDAMTQGTLLALYDPDRSQHILYRGETRNWPVFQAAFRGMLADKKASGGGQGLYFLSATVTSPTLAAQWKKAQASYPNAKFLQYEPVNRDSAYAASKQAFGDYLDAQYKLDQANVILALDAEFLSGIVHPGFNKLAGDWAAKRKLDGTDEMNRLYAVESWTTTTGLKAEHRLALRASEVGPFAAAILAQLNGGAAPAGYSWTDEQQKYLAALVKDLKANAGKSVVIPGEQQTPEVHLAAIAINQALGNAGKTVVYTETVNPMPSIQGDDLKTLIADLNAGKVDWLVIMNTNPVYGAPVDLDFITAMSKAKHTVHLGQYLDETGNVAEWHINGAHYLESWSDARSYDGTVSIIQPMIDPLYGGKSEHDILQQMLDDPDTSAYGAVRATWKQQLSAKGDYEFNWRKALHDGFLADTAFPAKSVAAKSIAVNVSAPAAADSIEVIFRPDLNLYDGRYANVGWLQELPRPVTNLSWDNAAMMSYGTLDKLKLEESDVIEISINGSKVLAPVLAVPGHADNVITLTLGQGRRNAGRVGSGMGFNAYDARTSSAPLIAANAQVKKTGNKFEFAVTKSHYIDHRAMYAGGDGSGTHSLEGNETLTRGIIRYATLDEFRKDPDFAHQGEGHGAPEPDTSMFASYRYDKNAWGMSIDMNSCVGCNACIVSCYAENNIAVVGRHQVKVGRNMQWLRIDTYFEGDLAAPRAHFQPMACQHCENAPCEQVCPVGATVHTPEGLNTMVYNRCVGTRYCSNNCPYKVRRFNFLLYSDYETESLKLMRNPDVTVRSRGVMEKCSYCVQRISAAKIAADKGNRQVRDGEIVTACQQACPTSAITFGNINDRSSKVAKLKAQTRSYGVLEGNNTRPRTTYVAEVLNVNQELAAALGEGSPQQNG